MAQVLQRDCPICGKRTLSSNQEFPFCSERCRLLDLANWASERYVISDRAADEAVPARNSGDEKDDEG